MAKSLKKIEALKLRREGKSIKEIASRVDVARSTASVWCREISLSKKQKDKLYKKMVDAGHKGRLMGAEANKRKKLDTLNSVKSIATKEISTLSKRDIQMLALGLYWGEGSKDKQGRFNFVNSDPWAILLILHWLKTGMGVKKISLRPQIYINDQHKKREKIILNFWAKKLSISESSFRKTIFISVPNKKVYENYDTYMGVLHLTISKSSYLKYQTMAFLQRAQECVQKL
jgi:transposase-like protein